MEPIAKIYPSLLDKFKSFINLDIEEFWWQDEAGKWHRNYDESSGLYHYSASEVEELAKQQLIDAINRVPFSSKAANMGTGFNNIVDYVLNGVNTSSAPIYIYDDYYSTILDEEELKYDRHFIESVADYLTGSSSQIFTGANLMTKYGIVYLYGYVDEIQQNKIIDLKFSKKYDFGNYKEGMQRHVYPYCLTESGLVKGIKEFEYCCYQHNGADILKGTQYREVYTYNHEQSSEYLRDVCERFIEFLYENKDKITDKKIFNG